MNKLIWSKSDATLQSSGWLPSSVLKMAFCQRERRNKSNNISTTVEKIWHQFVTRTQNCPCSPTEIHPMKKITLDTKSYHPGLHTVSSVRKVTCLHQHIQAWSLRSTLKKPIRSWSIDHMVLKSLNSVVVWDWPLKWQSSVSSAQATILSCWLAVISQTPAPRGKCYRTFP